MIVRLGVPKVSGHLLLAAQRLQAPLLLSAGSMWDKRAGVLRHPHSGVFDAPDDGYADVALDSAGFVAWRKHGGYPWPLHEYVEIGTSYPWAWWAAPDACCEPEIASDREQVEYRIRWTAGSLKGALHAVDQHREASIAARVSLGLDATPNYTIKDPMPVLQGWRPEDYYLSARWTETVLHEAGRHWPRLVGVGSVCRRQVHGPAGLLAILDVLHEILPPHVQLHGFGLKTTAIPLLRSYGTRIASVDSQAWDMAARHEAHQAKVSCTNALRERHMTMWWQRQQARLREPVQVGLFG